MNEMKITVDFKNHICHYDKPNDYKSLISGDYNSTKLVFDFDVENGTKIFEMRNDKNEVIFVDEIVNNEVILVGKDEEDNNCSLFTKKGIYVFEISLYDGDSKLTSESNCFVVNQEQVVVDGETVELYLPVFDKLINDVESAVNEVETIDIDVSKSGSTSTVTLTKKDGTNKEVQILDGIDGIDGANGQDGISPIATVTQTSTGATITITDKNGTTTANIVNGGPGGTNNYDDLNNKPSINDVELSGNKTSSDLGLQPAGNYVSDNNYVHTDNNYTSQEKQKLAGLSNYDDTEIKQSIANKVDKVTGKDLSTNDFTSTYKDNVDSNTTARHTHTNKQVLDNITDTDINNWNNKSNFSGNYNDLTNKPTIPAEVTENTVSGWGFTKNIGTITGITMNGVSKGVSGVVDLGTVITSHQDISGKLDTNKVKNTQSTVAGDVYDVTYINSMIGNIETLLGGI